MEILNNVESLKLFFPELILTVAILVMFVSASYTKGRRGSISHGVFALLTLIATALVLVALYLQPLPAKFMFHGLVVLDGFALFIKVLVLITAFVTILFALPAREIRNVEQPEYYTLVLALTLGLFVMAAAGNLLLIYLAIEMASTMAYILTGFLKKNQRSAEAALKYVLYGAAASGVMIYGMSLIYGLTGSLQLTGIRAALATGEVSSTALLIAIAMCLTGFGYKIATVPFHMWAPDVYEGAPLPAVAFFSVAPKAAGLAVLARFFYVAIATEIAPGAWQAFVDWPLIIAVIAALTMTVGNLAALPQNNVKRLLAYSSIAHAGYMLMGIVVLNDKGLEAILFYLFVYMLMNLGAFLVLLIVIEQTGSESIQAFRGLGWRSPLIAVAMALFLFSLTGLPPLAGFVGKVYLFYAVIAAKIYWLAIVAVVNSVISLYYYARIVKAMFLEQPGTSDVFTCKPLYGIITFALAIPILLLGVYWTPLWNFVHFSMQFIGFA